MLEKPSQYVKVCAFERRYPDSFEEPAQFAGGEHVILIRAALLRHNTLTPKSLMQENWLILPQKTAGNAFSGECADAAPFFEKGLLKEVRRYPLKEYANYTPLVGMLKAQFLAAQTDSDKCRAEAAKHAGNEELEGKFNSYADSFQTAALLIADALDSVQVFGT